MAISNDKTIRYNQNRPNGELMITGKRWKWYQPNDHRTGDCVIRSISKYFDITWLEAFDMLVPIAREMRENMGRVMLDTKGNVDKFGLEWHGVPIQKGRKRPTVEKFAKEHSAGRFIVKVSNHVVTVKDGYYWDIWECGDCAIYGYWTDKQ